MLDNTPDNLQLAAPYFSFASQSDQFQEDTTPYYVSKRLSQVLQFRHHFVEQIKLFQKIDNPDKQPIEVATSLKRFFELYPPEFLDVYGLFVYQALNYLKNVTTLKASDAELIQQELKSIQTEFQGNFNLALYDELMILLVEKHNCSIDWDRSKAVLVDSLVKLEQVLTVIYAINSHLNLEKESKKILGEMNFSQYKKVIMGLRLENTELLLEKLKELNELNKRLSNALRLIPELKSAQESEALFPARQYVEASIEKLSQVYHRSCVISGDIENTLQIAKELSPENSAIVEAVRNKLTENTNIEEIDQELKKILRIAEAPTKNSDSEPVKADWQPDSSSSARKVNETTKQKTSKTTGKHQSSTILTLIVMALQALVAQARTTTSSHSSPDGMVLRSENPGQVPPGAVDVFGPVTHPPILNGLEQSPGPNGAATVLAIFGNEWGYRLFQSGKPIGEAIYFKSADNSALVVGGVSEVLGDNESNPSDKPQLVVAWLQNGRVYQAHVDSFGNHTDAAPVNEGEEPISSPPTITELSNENYAITWKTDTELKMRVFNNSGSPLAPVFTGFNEPGIFHAPTLLGMVPLNNNQVGAICWQPHQLSTGGGSGTITAQVLQIHPNGAITREKFVATNRATYQNTAAFVNSDRSVTVTYDRSPSGSVNTLFMSRFDFNNETIGIVPQAILDDGHIHTVLASQDLDSNRQVLLYRDTTTSGQSGLKIARVQSRLNGDGNKIITEVTHEFLGNSDASQREANLVKLGSGKTIATWVESNSLVIRRVDDFNVTTSPAPILTGLSEVPVVGGSTYKIKINPTDGNPDGVTLGWDQGDRIFLLEVSNIFDLSPMPLPTSTPTITTTPSPTFGPTSTAPQTTAVSPTTSSPTARPSTVSPMPSQGGPTNKPTTKGKKGFPWWLVVLGTLAYLATTVVVGVVMRFRNKLRMTRKYEKEGPPDAGNASADTLELGVLPPSTPSGLPSSSHIILNLRASVGESQQPEYLDPQVQSRRGATSFGPEGAKCYVITHKTTTDPEEQKRYEKEAKDFESQTFLSLTQFEKTDKGEYIIAKGNDGLILLGYRFDRELGVVQYLAIKRMSVEKSSLILLNEWMLKVNEEAELHSRLAQMPNVKIVPLIYSHPATMKAIQTTDGTEIKTTISSTAYQITPFMPDGTLGAATKQIRKELENCYKKWELAHSKSFDSSKDGREKEQVEDKMENAQSYQNSLNRLLYHLMLSTAKAVLSLYNIPIYHKDLKPDNFLVTPEGEVRLIDFAYMAKQSIVTSQDRGILGDPRFLSPERITVYLQAWERFCNDENKNKNKQPYPFKLKVDTQGTLSYENEKDDAWAFGLILYDSFLGKHPIDPGLKLAGAAKTVFNSWDIDYLKAQVSASLENIPNYLLNKGIIVDILSKLLKVDPAERATIRDVIPQLEQLYKSSEPQGFPLHSSVRQSPTEDAVARALLNVRKKGQGQEKESVPIYYGSYPSEKLATIINHAYGEMPSPQSLTTHGEELAAAKGVANEEFGKEEDEEVGGKAEKAEETTTLRM